jgi:type IV pilus assembly protein PilB
VTLAPRLTMRLKVMSRLKISEHRVPQDGRMKMQIVKKRAIDFRVSVCSSLFGEKIVQRILNPISTILGIDVLGYEPDRKQLDLNPLSKPFGVILDIKTHRQRQDCLAVHRPQYLEYAGSNISIAEDLIEINMPGSTGSTCSRMLDSISPPHCARFCARPERHHGR